MKHSLSERISQSIGVFSAFGTISGRSQFGGYSLWACGVMFALVVDDELYLRANAHLGGMFRRRGMKRLMYRKRGLPICLHYYHVNEQLWSDKIVLLFLAYCSLRAAQRDNNKKNSVGRIKDLANLDITIERLLWRVGIHNINELRNQGAKSTYLKLLEIRKNLSFKYLLALAGAIIGCHYAALPSALYEDLHSWYHSLPQKNKPPI